MNESRGPNEQVQRLQDTLVQFARENARLQRVQAALTDFAVAAETNAVLRALCEHVSHSDGAKETIVVSHDRPLGRGVVVHAIGAPSVVGKTLALDPAEAWVQVLREREVRTGAADEVGCLPGCAPPPGGGWLLVPVERGGIGCAVLGVSFVSLRGAHDAEVLTATELARQAGAAVERTFLQDVLAESQSSMRVLSHQLIQTQEKERRRLAREIHDSFGSWLTSLRLNLHSIAADVEEGRPVERARLQDCDETVARLLQGARSIAVDLRPALLDEEGLIVALQWHLDRMRDQHRFETELVDLTSGYTIHPVTEITAFRIFQEALSNVMRHAEASSVRVLVETSGEDWLRLEIHDDGIGFDAEASREEAERGESMGLNSLHERASTLGGRLVIDSDPHHGGTTVRVLLPLGAPETPSNTARAAESGDR